MKRAQWWHEPLSVSQPRHAYHAVWQRRHRGAHAPCCRPQTVALPGLGVNAHNAIVAHEGSPALKFLNKRGEPLVRQQAHIVMFGAGHPPVEGRERHHSPCFFGLGGCTAQ